MHQTKIELSILKKHRFINDAAVLSDTPVQFCAAIRNSVNRYFQKNQIAYKYYKRENDNLLIFGKLSWQDYAAIRIADMLDNEGKEFLDQNLHGAKVYNRPFTLLFYAINDEKEISRDLLIDLDKLFDQFTGVDNYSKPDKKDIISWMNKFSVGTEKNIVEERKNNRDRIIRCIIEELDELGGRKGKYSYNISKTLDEKISIVLEWWKESAFHLIFAIRSSEELKKMLNNSVNSEAMDIMEEAESRGIPIFVNPYYLSLLSTQKEKFDDLAIRQYIFYSHGLIEEFGQISAWEKEDITVPGEPNVAGWILPSHNIHRRYPEVAILIPDTIGRACGGLCSSCQRMYGFQSGGFSFNLDKLAPKENWDSKLNRLLEYYEDDSQLRDILITGGDALMSKDKSIKKILDKILEMSKRKIEKNREKTKKYAEIKRIRLGTRLPVYLPQRVTKELIHILENFREKAIKIGISQFVIQTHFQSAMEVTPEVKVAIEMLLSSGWYVTNQLVFTSMASRKGHTAKLREVLNDIGVLTYYTFSVKGYRENQYNFATNSRAVQEQIEEKTLGLITENLWDEISNLTDDPSVIKSEIKKIRDRENIPFIATDRNVINLPGIGKSQTFRTIGLTDDGRRILEFDYDHNRAHSPRTNKLGKVIIIESKTISQYIRELQHTGSNPEDYKFTYGYSLSQTGPLLPIFKYPKSEFKITDKFTNIEI